MNFIKNNNQGSARKRTINREISVGPLTLRFITVIIVAALCILYLAQSTQGATENYQLREMEQTKEEMKKENERLEVDAVRLQTLKDVDVNRDKKDEEKKFEQASSVEYVE